MCRLLVQEGCKTGQAKKIQAERKAFFFEKKKQKPFICWLPRKLDQVCVTWEGRRRKSFLFLFLKNKAFLS